MTTACDDAAVQSSLTALVLSECAGRVSGSPRVGPLQRNNFSVVFTLDDSARGSFVVKIPKTDLRRRPDEGLLPITPEDRLLGRAEFESLQVMIGAWKSEDVRVSWVKPVAYIHDYNAVVT